jgi:hypothetical protein
VAERRAAITTTLAAIVLAACSVLALAACSVFAPPDARLCSAAQDLSAAMTLTATAIDADRAGDLARAQGLATQARSLTDLGGSKLDGAPDQQKTGPDFQALQEAFLQTAQAANALLPAFGRDHTMAPDLLAAAADPMARARAALPAMCFAIPADLETPGTS